MRPGLVVSLASLTAMLVVTAARAQSAVIAPRDVGPILATSTLTFIAARPHLVALSDGRVFVADGSKRVVVLLDSALANPKVVLDSAAGRNNTFSVGSFLTSFRGDSTLFFDRGAASLVVMDPKGALARTMARPSSGRGLGAAVGSSAPIVPGFTAGSGMPVSSPLLGLVFRWSASSAPRPRVAEGQPDTVIRVEDSSLVVRMDFVTRKLDTVARLAIGTNSVTTIRSNGGVSVSITTPLFPFFDDAVVTTDGSIALFSAREYRIDWVNADGTHTQGTCLTYAWQRITDDDRLRLLDSINTRRRQLFDSTIAKRAADSLRLGAAPMDTINIYSAGGEHTQRVIPLSPPRPPTFASPGEIPDYRPPTGRDAVLADGDNDVWLHPITALPSGPGTVWDVVNRQGVLIRRVRIPDGRTITGFGPGGIIYLAVRDAGVTNIQRARWRN